MKSVYHVSIFEVDFQDHNYKFIDECFRQFDNYKEALRYAQWNSIETMTFRRGYFINEVTL